MNPQARKIWGARASRAARSGAGAERFIGELKAYEIRVKA